VVEGALAEGYDIVLIDSFTEVQDDLKEALNISTKSAEKWIIKTMIEHNNGNNEARKHTTFFAIVQVTKGGIFVGSNTIKHATQGMLELRMDQSGQSYMSFSKNRRGSAGKRMYYSLAKSGDVFYDEKRYNNDENVRDAVEREKEELNGEESNFDALLGIASPGEQVDEEFETTSQVERNETVYEEGED
jgi:hypothetical protein